MVKEIERAGIPVVHMCTVTPISMTVGANRIVPTSAIPHPLGNPALSPEDEKILRRKLVSKALLALTTEGSVARYFRDLGVQVGAKTGSAQVSAQTESNAVFVCFAPYENPEVAVAIVVEHGGSGSELGAMAADILSHYFSAKGTREELLTENTLIR